MTITLRANRSRPNKSPDDVLDHAPAALQALDVPRAPKPPRKNLAEFLLESPPAGAELDLERRDDVGRTVEL